MNSYIYGWKVTYRDIIEWTSDWYLKKHSLKQNKYIIIYYISFTILFFKFI